MADYNIVKQVCRAVGRSRSVHKSGVRSMMKSRFAVFLLLVAAVLTGGAHAVAADPAGGTSSVAVSGPGGFDLPAAVTLGDSGWS
ncbi:hypothetical protein ACH4F6_21995 [Streptomyces sp. NPDC017936]|uniref:hypothetical protein n=1 Tax=Streptomyces sp. NPDC017936 TaxID=3365016 RepID=UPI00379CA2AD